MEIIDIDLSGSEPGALLNEFADSINKLKTPADVVSHTKARRAEIRKLRSHLCAAFPGVADFTQPGSAAGLLLLRQVPMGQNRLAELSILAECLGTIIKYHNEGDYIIEIKERIGIVSTRPGFANSKEFFGHTDLSYADNPPSFMCLHSISNDRAQGGISGFSDTADILKVLSPEDTAALEKWDFLFPAPQHFANERVIRRPILERVPSYPFYQIRFRRDGIGSATAAGISAVTALCRAIEEVSTETFLEPRTIAVVNNRRVLHARTAFLGGASQPQRHINRLYFEPRS